jgi:hypothetical protein
LQVFSSLFHSIFAVCGKLWKTFPHESPFDAACVKLLVYQPLILHFLKSNRNIAAAKKNLFGTTGKNRKIDSPHYAKPQAVS